MACLCYLVSPQTNAEAQNVPEETDTRREVWMKWKGRKPEKIHVIYSAGEVMRRKIARELWGKTVLHKGLPQEQGTCLLVNVPRLCHLFGQTTSFMPYCLILLRQFLSLPSQESSTVDKCQKQALLNVNMTQSTLIWQQTRQGVCVGYINWCRQKSHVWAAEWTHNSYCWQHYAQKRRKNISV